VTYTLARLLINWQGIVTEDRTELRKLLTASLPVIRIYKISKAELWEAYDPNRDDNEGLLSLALHRRYAQFRERIHFQERLPQIITAK
jgi:hypothetical protein